MYAQCAAYTVFMWCMWMADDGLDQFFNFKYISFLNNIFNINVQLLRCNIESPLNAGLLAAVFSYTWFFSFPATIIIIIVISIHHSFNSLYSFVRLVDYYYYMRIKAMRLPFRVSHSTNFYFTCKLIACMTNWVITLKYVRMYV